jgi:hypothetical protein
MRTYLGLLSGILGDEVADEFNIAFANYGVDRSWS